MKKKAIKILNIKKKDLDLYEFTIKYNGKLKKFYGEFHILTISENQIIEGLDIEGIIERDDT